MLVDVTIVTLAVAILLSIIGIHWEELSFTVIGGIAWIMAGVWMFNVEIPYAHDGTVSIYTYAAGSTAPIGWFFAAIGVIVIIYSVFGALKTLAHPRV